MDGRIFLVHWHAEGAAETAEHLRGQGWEVTVESEDGARAAKDVLANPPDGVVIYLTHLPSHGRETAHAIKFNKAGRGIPIIFVGGDEEQVEKTRSKVPFARFASPDGLDQALKDAGLEPKAKEEPKEE